MSDVQNWGSKPKYDPPHYEPPQVRDMSAAEAAEATAKGSLAAGGATPTPDDDEAPTMVLRPVERALTELLDSLGLEPTPERLAHAAPLVDALITYADRSGERSEVWRRSGLKGQCFHLLAKAERAFQQVMLGQQPNADHFIDQINYAAFALRLLKERGNDLNGDWPWKE